MAAPRVEVGGVRMSVLGVGRAVEVEDELIRGEEHVAVAAFYTLSPGTVVPRRNELSLAAPATGMSDIEGKVVG